MVEVWGEPEGALSEMALVQWEDAAVVTVRANVNRQGAPALPSCLILSATWQCCACQIALFIPPILT